jgi:hypothetical protein
VKADRPVGSRVIRWWGGPGRFDPVVTFDRIAGFLLG